MFYFPKSSNVRHNYSWLREYNVQLFILQQVMASINKRALFFLEITLVEKIPTQVTKTFLIYLLHVYTELKPLAPHRDSGAFPSTGLMIHDSCMHAL